MQNSTTRCFIDNKYSPESAQKGPLLTSDSKESVAGNKMRPNTTYSLQVRLGSFQGRRDVPCANKGSVQKSPLLVRGSEEEAGGKQMRQIISDLQNFFVSSVDVI